MPNFIAIALRGVCPQICEILRFCDFFVVLSFSGYRPTFFSQSRAGQTTGRILAVHGFNDVSSFKDVLFRGFDDDP